MTQTETKDVSPPPPPGWRFKLGIFFFGLAWVVPLAVPLVALTDLPLAWKTAISGFLLVGAPEVFSLACIACLGRAGFNYLTGKLKALFRRYGPPQRVSRRRYYLGLAMLILPALFGYAMYYAPDILPGYEANRVVINICADLVFFSSFFVLGGEFWDKVRALFVYGATAQFPEKRPVVAGQ